MSHNIVLITDFFPYTYSYETFLETEVRYWEKVSNVNLTILPMHSDVECRNIPKNIKIDLSFADYLASKEKEIEKKSFKIWSVFCSLGNPLFWKELKYTRYKLKRIKELLLSLRLYKIYKGFFEEYLKNATSDSLLYTYWFTECTYAISEICMADNISYKVITRTHGYDLYESRTLTSYMPLRRQFPNKIDHIFTLSESANHYLIETYGFDQNNISVSRLGVDDLGITTQATDENQFHLVSCSALRPVKQVNLIIDILEKLSENYSNIDIHWTHIGEGSLFKTLSEYARIKLRDKKNITYSFLGHLNNSEVYTFYKKNRVDVFINVSQSEGVPVSIMEALSCRIPIVASDVGGISDMVKTDYNGKLVAESSSLKGYLDAFSTLDFFKNPEIRENAYRIFLHNYNAKINYFAFILYLSGLMRKKKEINGA